jgi:PAS domain S-box-containing protein
MPLSASVDPLLVGSVLIESAEDAMISMTPDGTVTSWNHGAEKIYGLGAAEVLGSPAVRQLIIPAELQKEADNWLKWVGEGETIHEETRRLRPDGSSMMVDFKMVPVCDSDGHVIAAVAIVRDITDRRLREHGERDHAEAQLWMRRIDDALSGGSCAFVLAAQPIIDLRSGAVDHDELLLRMRLPEGRLAPPGEFLPHAERSGRIRAIDAWVAREGLRIAAERAIAINVSAKSFNNETMLAAIEIALRTGEVSARDLTFEVTETAAAEDLEGAVSLFGRLTKLGCRVALDDFGTGFGSFTYLRRLPATELKIDMEFTRELTTSRSDRRVVSSIVAVAKKFGLKTVAEGIEDDAAKEVVTRLGVDLGQGWLFGRPAEVAVDDVTVPGH